jgi:hypothetical protein
MIFSWLCWSYGFSGGRPQSKVYVSGNILLTWLTVDGNFYHLAEEVFVRFLHSQVTPSSHLCVLFEKRNAPKEWRVFLLLLGMVYLHKLFAIFLHGRLASSTFIYYLFVYLIIYNSMTNGYLFHTLGRNSVLCFMAQTVPALAIGSSVCWPLCPIGIPTQHCLYLLFLLFWALSYFLAHTQKKLLQAHLIYVLSES